MCPNSRRFNDSREEAERAPLVTTGGAAYGSPDSSEFKSKNRAQQAFDTRDVDAAIREHAKQAPEEHSNGASDYLKSIVFGGMDGIVTTFAVVTAAAGAEEYWKTVLVFGLANMFADAWSMGTGEFYSSKAELNKARRERQREEWEVDNCFEGEIAEMVDLYEKKGFPTEDAKALVAIISKDKKRFVDIMMVEELGITENTDDTWHEPAKHGVVMFLSFIFFGTFPLVAYFGGKGKGLDWVFGLACGITGFALLILGGAKGKLSGDSIPFTSVKMLAMGCVSGGVSFGLSELISYLITGDPTKAQ
jgi:VIT1/CCC1 family predicted Fe2+/Mn2+ transporter